MFQLQDEERRDVADADTIVSGRSRDEGPDPDDDEDDEDEIPDG